MYKNLNKYNTHFHHPDKFKSFALLLFFITEQSNHKVMLTHYNSATGHIYFVFPTPTTNKVLSEV